MGQRLSNKLSFGHGLNDVQNATSTTGYVIWYSMMRRAYSPVYHAAKPAYKSVEVASEWKRLSGFLPWFNDNYVEGWQLDKDLLGDGRLYSAESCCFLPPDLNSVMINTRHKAGVYFKRANGKFCAQYSSSKTGRATIYLGLFEDEASAYEAYNVAKRQHIREMAEAYKDCLSLQAYNRLCNI